MSKIIALIAILAILNNSALCNNGLTFLEFKDTEVESKPVRGRSTVSPDDMEHMVEGFLNGIAIFNTPHHGSCQDKDFDVITHDVSDIIDIIKTIKIDSSIVTKLMDLVVKFKSLYQDLNTIVGPCAEYAAEIQEQILKVIDFVESPVYIAELPVHILWEMSTIESKEQAAAALYTKGDFTGAGNGFGDLVHFALLWNFQ
jgi:hypothetical protein